MDFFFLSSLKTHSVGKNTGKANFTVSRDVQKKLGQITHCEPVYWHTSCAMMTMRWSAFHPLSYRDVFQKTRGVVKIFIYRSKETVEKLLRKGANAVR